MADTATRILHIAGIAGNDMDMAVLDSLASSLSFVQSHIESLRIALSLKNGTDLPNQGVQLGRLARREREEATCSIQS